MFRYQKGYIFAGHTFVINKSDIHNAPDDMFVTATALLPDEWISVKDKLPRDEKYNGTILATDGVTVITAPSSSVAPGGTITHWIPLPEPPKEDTP